jgi:DNA-binding PadR family transcriptional regulator
MSETHDKRRRTDLDLFILALIDSGVSTPYAFQKTASLSQCATTPALQRLLDARLVRQGKPGVRGRINYKVSAAGKKLLKDGWLPLIEAGPNGDLDSDLRVALLAIWGGGDRRLAANFLRESANKKMQSLAVDEPDSDCGELAPLAHWYTDLRSATAKALLAAEAEAIRTMADALPRKLTAKPRRAHTPKSQQDS